MPLLRIDKFGNLYECDPASSDGSGYKGRVPKSGGGDVAYDKSSQASSLGYDAKLREEKRLQAYYDENEAKRERLNQLKNLKLKKIKKARNEIEAHPDYQEALLKIGLAQSRLPETGDQIGLSGNGRSANGMFGAMGESPQSLAAQWTTGFLKNPNLVASINAQKAQGQEIIHGADPHELKQFQMSQNLLKQRNLEAIREAKRVELESRLNKSKLKKHRRDNEPYAMDQDLDASDESSEVRSGVPMYAGDASSPESKSPVGVVTHPMIMFFRRK